MGHSRTPSYAQVRNPSLPAGGGVGHVLWTLCLWNNTLLNGLGSCPTNGSWPYGSVFDPKNGYLYVTDVRQDEIAVVNTSTQHVVGDFAIGANSNSEYLAYDPYNDLLYVTFSSGSQLGEVDAINLTTNSVVKTFSFLPSSVDNVAYDPYNHNMYVALAPNTPIPDVAVINSSTNTIASTNITAGGQANYFAYDSVSGDLYTFYLAGGAYIGVLNSTTNHWVANVSVGLCGAESGLAIDAWTNEVYAPCVNGHGNSTVYVVNASSDKVMANVTISGTAQPPAFDDSNDDIYIPAQAPNITSVISGNTNQVVNALEVGGDPTFVSYDSTNQLCYVSNGESRSLSIIGPSYYSLNFTETGLPTGTNWSVTLNGQTQSSTISTITFNEPNGTYAYTVGAVSGYTASPSSGSVTVNGVSRTVSITFTPFTSATYAVTFSESGLPSGTSWSVTLNGAMKSGTGSIVFTEPNGTYSYVIGTVAGYTASPSSGNILVIGFPIPQSIAFTLTSPGNYRVTFQESGLPSGTSWSVTISGSTITSTTSSIAFGEPNGSYSFSVGAVAGYTTSPPSGTINVSGAAVSKAITFTALPPGQYSLVLSETGLPTGTNWSVTVGTTTHTSTGSTISFTEVNGTYSYTVGAVTGYTATPSSGSVTVNGAAKTVSIAFAKASAGTTYAVTFTETGLPTGTSWSVTLNGSTKSSTTATITFQEPNGSYAFTVGSVSGYTVGPSPGAIKVNGVAVSQSITFTSSTSPGKTNQTNGFLGLPGYEGYILVGVIVAVAAAGAVILLLRKRNPPRGDGVQDSKNIADGAAEQVAVE